MIRAIFITTMLLATPIVRADDEAPATAPATQEAKIIQAGDKDAIESNLGARVTVEGTISSIEWSKSGKVCNIEFEGTETSKFMSCLFERSRAAFDEAFGGDVAAALSGKKVQITGEIEPYGGSYQKWMDRSQIVLHGPDQVKIVE